MPKPTRDDDESFISRWSRLKRSPAAGDEDAQRFAERSEQPGGAPAPEPDEELAAQLQAFRDLWRSDPDLCRPDELDDFLEDFTEAGRGVPAELLTTAYAIGRGFWRAEDPASESEAPCEVGDGEARRTRSSATDEEPPGHTKPPGKSAG